MLVLAQTLRHLVMFAMPRDLWLCTKYCHEGGPPRTRLQKEYFTARTINNWIRHHRLCRLTSDYQPAPPCHLRSSLNSEMQWHCSQALIDNFTVFLGRRTEIGMSTMSCWSVSDCTTHRLTALSWPHLGRDINLDDLEVTAAPVISQSSQVNTNKLSSKIHLIYIWDNWNEQFRSFVNFLKKMFWCLARSIFYSYKKSDWRDRGELR